MRSALQPSSRPTTVAAATDTTPESTGPRPRSTVRYAVPNAAMPSSPAWPSEICPAAPNSSVRPIAATA